MFFIQAHAKKPVIFSVQPNSSLEEHGMVTLSCVGDVGNPQGSLKIWKIYKQSNTKQLLKIESEVKSDTENCTHIVNLTATYNLTKEDNGAQFRCSSQNQYTTHPAPAIEIGPIEAFCKLKLFNLYFSVLKNVNLQIIVSLFKA